MEVEPAEHVHEEEAQDGHHTSSEQPFVSFSIRTGGEGRTGRRRKRTRRRRKDRKEEEEEEEDEEDNISMKCKNFKEPSSETLEEKFPEKICHWKLSEVFLAQVIRRMKQNSQLESWCALHPRHPERRRKPRKGIEHRSNISKKL
ncbi:hypothetical protein PUN28_001602 [Cardiocondyla obscurior]|uniref:Uncharacterized protein n=1 Tax=Cardiocondyla obscurior TaxID=286306 RepID=A0AAW2GQB6_9HYME